MALYHFLSTLLSPVVIVVFSLYSLITGNKKRGLAQHFGSVPKTDPDETERTLWVHALSRGEVNSVAFLLKTVHQQQPETRIIVSVTTDSGYDAAKQQIPFAKEVIFHPFDCWPFSLRAIERIRPDVFILTETGFWPGLCDLLRSVGIPTLLIQARLSQKSFQRYSWLGPLPGWFFNGFSKICVQNAQGEQDLLALGVEDDRLVLTGDTKFDELFSIADATRRELRHRFAIKPEHRVFVAGSTHRGEEEILLQAFKNLHSQGGSPVLILAPRRLERIPEIAGLLNALEIEFIKRTDLDGESGRTAPVILLDTLGELSSVYAIADLAFVGNSLVPPGGGHNLVEPVAFGVPVLFGPHLQSRRSVADELIAENLGCLVESAPDIETRVNELLTDSAEDLRNRQAKAEEWIQKKQGASRQIAAIVFELLDAP